ncbi:MAG: uracil-DNA glycosylase [Actinomycetota bacterium]
MGAQSLADVGAAASSCRLCPLWEGKTLVFGSGDPNAELMFIGEGPGELEDELGEPFVGVSGVLLSGMLCEVGIRREAVYLANVIKHRPVTGHIPPKNRHPSPSEIAACMPWLNEQIRLVNPRLIIPLGEIPMGRFLDGGYKITEVHGQRFSWRDRAVLPTFHPSYVLRNQRKLTLYRQDFRTIRRMLDASI